MSAISRVAKRRSKNKMKCNKPNRSGSYNKNIKTKVCESEKK